MPRNEKQLRQIEILTALNKRWSKLLTLGSKTIDTETTTKWLNRRLHLLITRPRIQRERGLCKRRWWQYCRRTEARPLSNCSLTSPTSNNSIPKPRNWWATPQINCNTMNQWLRISMRAKAKTYSHSHPLWTWSKTTVWQSKKRVCRLKSAKRSSISFHKAHHFNCLSCK